MSAPIWVFGYGSLVSPDSLGATLGRAVDVTGNGWSEAELDGYVRAWNYGIGHWVGHDADGASWALVALGLVADPSGSTNGIVVRVEPDELLRLDDRERDYDRVEVTEALTSTRTLDGPAVTYVPRRSAVERYELARATGRAAVERRYVDLVDGAFAALGPDRVERYRGTTPAPDVPVLDLVRGPVVS